MWQTYGYVLLVAASVLVFSASIIWTARYQIRFSSWLIYFLFCAPLFAVIESGSDVILGLLLFSSFLSELFTRPILRRRVIPPRVRVTVIPQRSPLCIIVWTVVLLPTIMSALLYPEESFKWITSVPTILAFASIGGFFIMMLLGYSEICASGLWLNGTLVGWNNYESSSWAMKDKKAVVELAIAGRRPYEFYSSLLLAVPPENVEAAKQLLEANLVDSAPEEAKA
jgi:hypothetical protein